MVWPVSESVVVVACLSKEMLRLRERDSAETARRFGTNFGLHSIGAGEPSPRLDGPSLQAPSPIRGISESAWHGSVASWVDECGPRPYAAFRLWNETGVGNRS